MHRWTKLSSRDDFVIRLGSHEIQTPAICASILDKNLDLMKSRSEEAIREGANLVELRLDGMEKAAGWEGPFREDVPIIVTNRSREEGGYFKGSEDERIELLLDAIDHGASCIDMEMSTSESRRKRILKAAEKEGSSVILSHHSFEDVPPIRELTAKARQMDGEGCDLAKLVGFAYNYGGALRILEFLIRSSEEIKIPVIAFAMGEKGRFTRMAAPLLGSPITYASVGKKAAPGQLGLSATEKILGKYRLDP